MAHFLAIQNGEDPAAPDRNLAWYMQPDMRVRVHHSAVATYHAPGDPSGVGGMRREHLRATPSWRNGPAHYDCAYVSRDTAEPGFRGFYAVRVRLFFSFKFESHLYPCALVEWFVPVGDAPDEDTGMWIVEPEVNDEGHRPCEIIHLESIYRSAHLIGVYGKEFVPKDLRASDSLDAYRAFWVGKYIDYHAHGHVY